MLLCGILCSAISVVGFYSKTLLFILGIFLALCFGIAVFKQINLTLIVALTVVIVMLISTVITIGKVEDVEKFTGEIVNCDVAVCEITYKRGDTYRADIEIIESKNLSENTKLSVWYNDAILKSGQIVNANIKLYPSDIKYKASSYSKNIYLYGNMDDITLTDKKDFVLTAIGETREYIKTTVFNNLDYREGATLCALIFGDKQYFTDEFYNNVKSSGVSHVMVVSGLHLSIFVIIFTVFTERFIYNKYVKSLGIITTVLLLTALCGFTMSMLRAGMTYVLMALGISIGRKGVAENTLGAAVSFILIFSPFAVFSIAFQLSVLSTAGILCVALPVIKTVISRKLIKNKMLEKLFSAVVVSLSAYLFTLPVVIYVFGYISVVSIISNLLICYAVTVVLWIAVIALLCNSLWTGLGKLIFIPCGMVLKYINQVINYMGSLPFAVIYVGKFAFLASLISIAIIIALMFACKNWLYMIKLNEITRKQITEGGKTLKWR